VMTTVIEAFARFSILRRRLLIGVDRPINAEAPRKSRRAIIILPHQLEPPIRPGFEVPPFGQLFAVPLRGESLPQMKRRFKINETAFHLPELDASCALAMRKSLQSQP
jgi:galactitol-specific phosphotransferase system IIC component